MDPDRNLPGHPGRLRALQSYADRNRRQLLDDGAAVNLARAVPDHGTADCHADADKFGVLGHTTPDPLTDRDAVRDSDALRGSDVNSLSHRFAGTLDGPPGLSCGEPVGMAQMATGVLGELADAADGYDHQAPGRPRAVRERSQVEFGSHRVVVALDPRTAASGPALCDGDTGRVVGPAGAERAGGELR